ncbi:Uncharacterised protein [Bordetella pertussis]|nr:Uncharacterised protein [Bordetella pertussis]
MLRASAAWLKFLRLATSTKSAMSLSWISILDLCSYAAGGWARPPHARGASPAMINGGNIHLA